MDSVRRIIKQKTDERGMSLAALSKAVGKNHAYMQQFMERHVPKDLPEKVRVKVANALRVDERLLGGPERRVVPLGEEFEAPVKVITTNFDGMIAELDARAGMGGGGFIEHRDVRQDGNHADPVKPEKWQFPGQFLREELRAPADRILIVETQGDSMTPTISPGERVVVDTGHKIPSPDGIYALRDRFGAIVVKRLQVMRRGDPPTIKVISDNEAHADEDVRADEIEIVGRVICGLKRY